MERRPRRRQLSDEEKQELYQSMLDDLQSGECVVFDDSRSGPTTVLFCRKELGWIDHSAERIPFQPTPQGVFFSVAHALRTVVAEMAKQQFWPDIYHINDHGNVALWDSKGREIAAWV